MNLDARLLSAARLAALALFLVPLAAAAQSAPPSASSSGGPAGGTSPSPSPTPTPAASFVPDATAHAGLSPGDPPPKLTLAVTGLDKAAMAAPQLISAVRDVAQGEITVGEIAVRELPKGASTRFFELTLPVKNLPRGTTVQRTMAITVGARDQLLPYTLTNVSATSYSLAVKPPATSAIDLDGWIPVTVVVGPVAATGVRLLQPTLAEKNTKRPIVEPAPKLCTSPDPKPNSKQCDDGSGLPLSASSAHLLFVGPVQRVGTYENQTLTVASDQKPDGDSATFTVYVSSWWHKLIGLLAILLGVAASWVITTLVRNRIDRDRAYLPVLALRRTLIDLNARIAKVRTEIATKATRRCIAEQLASLDDDALQDHGLPLAVPSPWSSPGTPDAAAFRQYVQDVADWTSILVTIVDGLEFVGSKWDNAWPEADKKRVRDAANALDDLAAQTPRPSATDVSAAAQTARKAIHPPTTEIAMLAHLGDEPPAPSPERVLRVEITRLALVSWLIVAAITVLVGGYVLIYSDAGLGFGSVRDDLVAFFWGLGIPTGTQLASATTSTVRTAFNVPTAS